MSKTKKILIIIGLVVIAITSILVAKSSYDSQKKAEEKKQAEVEESISNLTVINLDKLESLFKSEDTKIVFIGSLTCPHCTGIKPKINNLVEELGIDVYYLELSELTDEEQERLYSMNDFLSQGTSIPLVMAVKNDEVIDSFVGNIETEEIESFLKKNLNLE